MRTFIGCVLVGCLIDSALDETVTDVVLWLLVVASWAAYCRFNPR